MGRNKYRQDINHKTYYVHVFELWFITTIAVRDSRWSDTQSTTYAKKRYYGCDDVEKASANLLSKAVQNREETIRNAEEYDEKIERALDVVKDEYES